VGEKLVEMTMRSKAPSACQSSFLMPTLREQLDARQALYQLAQALPWTTFEEAFADCYSEEGRPAKPVRLMVGLLLLKQLHNLGVVAQWVQNPYWQFFCGCEDFQWELPCDPSDLVYFRQRIGEDGVAVIFAASAQLHGKKSAEAEVVIDSTVQEPSGARQPAAGSPQGSAGGRWQQAVTYPTDTKLCRRIIARCWKLADRHGVRLRRRYTKLVRQSLLAQRWRQHSKRRKEARRGVRRLRTIAGRLVRELTRKLPAEVVAAQAENFTLYRGVLAQKPRDTGKVYSLHEPHIYCIAKGKEHKKYEFGTKASLAMTKTGGILVAAVAHEENCYDGHTLPEVLEQAEVVQGERPAKAIVDRGYRGVREVGGTQILVPGKAPAGQSPNQRQAMRQRFRRRCAIEPTIAHLKSDFRLARNYLRGFAGDSLNLLLAAAAWNFRKWLRFWRLFLPLLLLALPPEPRHRLCPA
jgi:IS5 family transposase